MRASGPREIPFKLPAGLAVRLDWAVEPERASRVANVCLAIAVVVYAVLVLWLMRGVGFVEDDLPTFATSDGFSPGALLESYNGHLIAVTRLIFAGSLRIFGPEHAPIQVAVVIAGAAAAVTLFALLRRRLAAYPSLALALVVLFFGTTGVPLLSTVTMFAQASAFGLAAYIALDSQLRRRDLIACALLILSVLSFEVGVAFAIGAAAWILVETGRWRRIWIAAIPVVLYAAWYVWAPPYDAGQLSNALLIPSYAASSAAAALSALAGLSADFSDLSPQGVLDTGWGQLIAVLLAIATAVQVYRRGISGLMMAGAGILAVLWIGGGLTLTIGFRVPESARYAYPVAIALILIFSAAFSGYLSGRRGLIVSAVFLVIAMPLNLWELRSGALATRAKSDLARVDLAIIEMQRDQIDPDFYRGFSLPVRAGDYLAASNRLGSIALPVAELPSQNPQVRGWADDILAMTIPPRLVPVDGRPRGCERMTAAETGAGVIVEPGTVLVAAAAAELTLRRFADEFSIPAGDLSPGVPSSLVLPADSSSQPWQATTNPPQPLKVCDPVSATG